MSNKRFKTQIQEDIVNKHSDEKFDVFEKIVIMASQQKLLPKILYQMDFQLGYGKKQRFLLYQSLVKNIYGKQGKIPLKYNPQEALTNQQKIRRKIQKLQRNQLDIQYFNKIKTREGKIIPTFKGHLLQSKIYQTKQELKIFKDFNQSKFKKSYTQLFDDKLQLKQVQLINKKRNRTLPVINQTSIQKKEYLLNPKFNKLEKQFQIHNKDNSKILLKKVNLRPLTQAIQIQKLQKSVKLKQINDKYRPHIQKVKIGRILNDIEHSNLYLKMIKIGSFPRTVSQSTICLTRQSISKYLKSSYQRQIRITDFLEIKSTLNLQEYHSMCTKLKLMPIQHIIFMAFLFYDFNNDGYICENDLRRIKSLYETKTNYLIQQDFKVINGIKQKINFQHLHKQQQYTQVIGQLDKSYLQLYKLPEITQSTYFNWINKKNLLIQEINLIQRKQKSSQKNQLQAKQKLAQVVMKMNNKTSKRNISQKSLLNPSILKYKTNFYEQSNEVRKYLLGIKANKTYISYEQFKNSFVKLQKRKKSLINEQSSRLSQVKVKRSINEEMNGEQNRLKRVNSVKRWREEDSRVRNQMKQRNQNNTRQKESVQSDLNERTQNINKGKKLDKPFIWYDLMNRLGGVRYQGLKYE